MWKVDDLNLFTIEMDRKRLIKRNHRPGFFWFRRKRSSHDFLFGDETVAYVGMRNNRRFRSKHFVATDVIEMPVRVQDEL